MLPDWHPGDARAPRSPAAATSPHRRRNIFLLGAVGLAVAIVAGFFLLPRVAAKKVDKSIAVLPFENFSEDKDNAFFADGIQDDILTNLSKIGDLKVISRTSVMGYRGKEKNVRQIGKELGVSAVLEGSVRREGNRVRVNVQLINAENDRTSLGGGLRPRTDRCLRHPDGPRAKDRARVAGAAFPERTGGDDPQADRERRGLSRLRRSPQFADVAGGPRAS